MILVYSLHGRTMQISSLHPSLPPPHLLPLPPVGSQSVNMQVTDTGRSIVEQDIPGESTALDEVTAVLLCCARTGTARHSGTTPRRNRTRTKHLRTRQRKSNTLIDTTCFFFFYSFSLFFLFPCFPPYLFLFTNSVCSTSAGMRT